MKPKRKKRGFRKIEGAETFDPGVFNITTDRVAKHSIYFLPAFLKKEIIKIP